MKESLKQAILQRIKDEGLIRSGKKPKPVKKEKVLTPYTDSLEIFIKQMIPKQRPIEQPTRQTIEQPIGPVIPEARAERAEEARRTLPTTRRQPEATRMLRDEVLETSIPDRTAVSTPQTTLRDTGLPAEETIRQAEPRTLMQKGLDILKKPFVKNPKEIQAEAQAAYAVSKSRNIPLEEVTPKVVEEAAREVGLKQVDTPLEFYRKAMIFPIAAGLMTNPLATGAAIATFAVLSEAENFIISKLKDEKYKFGDGKNFQDLLPEDANEHAKVLAELVDLAAKGWVMHKSYKGVSKYFNKQQIKQLQTDRSLEVIGLKENASRQHVRDAYYKLIHKYHPDVVIATGDKKLINEYSKIASELNKAYNYLKRQENYSPYKRGEYPKGYKKANFERRSTLLDTLKKEAEPTRGVQPKRIPEKAGLAEKLTTILKDKKAKVATGRETTGVKMLEQILTKIKKPTITKPTAVAKPKVKKPVVKKAPVTKKPKIDERTAKENAKLERIEKKIAEAKQVTIGKEPKGYIAQIRYYGKLSTSKNKAIKQAAQKKMKELLAEEKARVAKMSSREGLTPEQIESEEAIIRGEKDVSISEISESVRKEVFKKKTKLPSGDETEYIGGKGYASTGDYAKIDIPDTSTNIQMPEMLKLSKELTGGKVPFLKKYRKASGMFYPGEGKIGLDPRIFEDPNLSAQVFAHEIGHLIDNLPEMDVKLSGNLMNKVSTVRDANREITKFIEKASGTKLATAKKELWELSKWWRPIDEATATPNQLKYRKKASEMYADWVSVLFNKPDILPKQTPEFYKLFFKYLDEKPVVKDAYFELMDFLTGTSDSVMKARDLDVEAMFAEGEMKYRERMIQNKQREKSIFYKSKYLLFDKNTAIIKYDKIARKEGKIKKDEDSIVHSFEENEFVANDVKNILAKFDPTRKDYLSKGLTDVDFGKILFYNRVVGDRSGVANPLGHNKQTAEKQLNYLERQLGVDKFKLAENALKKFNDVYRKEILQELYDTGMMKKDLYDELSNSENPYGTFQSIKHILEGFVSPSILQQVGTLDDIANPLPATLLKMIAFKKAIQRNKLRRETQAWVKEKFLDDIKEIKVDGRTGYVKPAPQGYDILKTKEKGINKAYYVDEYIVKSLEYQSSDFGNIVQRTIGLANSYYFRPLFVGLNVGFQSYNLIRDFRRTWAATPGLTLLGLTKQYVKAYKASEERAVGIENPTIKEMEDNKMLGLTYNDIIVGNKDEVSQAEALARRYDLMPKETRKIKILQPLLETFEGIKMIGDTIETLPKVSAYMHLKDKGIFTKKELAHFIRGRVGTPDFTRKGAASLSYNNLFLFANIAKEGWRADYETGITDPKTRSGHFYKRMSLDVVPKILMWLTSIGVFGKYMQELMRKQSEYNKRSYTVIPVGEDEKGNSIAIKIPADEMGRILGALVWEGLRAIQFKKLPTAFLTSIIDYTGGQLPGISPALEIPGATLDMVLGKNPYDKFRERPLLTDDEMEAGGWYKWEPFLRWTVSKLGILRLDVRDRVNDYSTIQKMTKFTPIVNRFISISRYGVSEELEMEKVKVMKKEAIARLDKKDALLKYTKKWFKGGQDFNELFEDVKSAVYGGETVTKLKITSLRKSFVEDILLVDGDPNMSTLIYAGTNLQQIAVLKKIKESMTAREFNNFGNLIMASDVITKETWNKAIEELK